MRAGGWDPFGRSAGPVISTWPRRAAWRRAPRRPSLQEHGGGGVRVWRGGRAGFGAGLRGAVNGALVGRYSGGRPSLVDGGGVGRGVSGAGPGEDRGEREPRGWVHPAVVVGTNCKHGHCVKGHAWDEVHPGWRRRHRGKASCGRRAGGRGGLAGDVPSLRNGDLQGRSPVEVAETRLAIDSRAKRGRGGRHARRRRRRREQTTSDPSRGGRRLGPDRASTPRPCRSGVAGDRKMRAVLAEAPGESKSKSQAFAVR